MFSDVAHYQQLWHSVWPSMDVIQVTSAGAYDTFSAGGATAVTGNAAMTGGTWNYGVNFGGPTKSSWTSGKDTDRAMYGVRGEGMFGNSFIGDSAYSTANGGTGIFASPVSMCPGTAGSVCKG